MNRRGRAATLHQFVDLAAEVEGVHLRHLPPLTTVLVQTRNSLYRVVIAQGPEVYIHGGAFFPDPTRAYLEGATIGGSSLKVGWIAVGLRLEIRLGSRRILTSRVRAITTESPSETVTH